MAGLGINLIIETPECEGLLVERAETPQGPWTTLPIGQNYLPTEVESYYVRLAEDDPDSNCCFNFWVYTNDGTPDYNRTIFFDGGNVDVTLTLVTQECSRNNRECAPRYKNYETLIAKANCICKRYSVELLPICETLCGGEGREGVRGFFIVDNCVIQPESGQPHIVAIVSDPNALLAIIECLCGNELSKSTEYVIVEENIENK